MYANSSDPGKKATICIGLTSQIFRGRDQLPQGDYVASIKESPVLGKFRTDVMWTIVWSIVSTISFISPNPQELYKSLFGEVLPPGGKMSIPVLNILISLFILPVLLFLSGPYRTLRGANKRRGRFRGFLLVMALEVMALTELTWPQSIPAQFVACGISILCALAAWKMFALPQKE